MGRSFESGDDPPRLERGERERERENISYIFRIYGNSTS